MFKFSFRAVSAVLVLALILGVGGVYATWNYADKQAETVTKDISFVLNPWQGPDIYHPNTVYITAMSEKSSSGLDVNEGSYEPWTANVETTLSRSATTATATYQITVYNNTSYTCSYRGIEYDTNLSGYNNSYITTDSRNTQNKIYISTSFPNGDTVAPGQELTFEVTYTVGSRIDANSQLKTLVEYHFGINVETEAEAVDAIIETFDQVLNTSSTYEELMDKIDDKYDGRDWTATFIGNVTGSDSADTEAIQALFGNNLTLTIDGVETNITLIAKSENIDGNNNTGNSFTATDGTNTSNFTGCEMTLYITADSLNRSGASVTVYAIVYTCDVITDADGNVTYSEWYRLGSIYEGQAQVVGYYGNVGNNTTGSFDTGSWSSVAGTYTAGNYSYSISANNGIGTIINASPNATANNILQPLVTMAGRVVGGEFGDYAGDAMNELEKAYEHALRFCTVAADGTITVNADATRAQVVPCIEDLTRTLEPFEDIIN